MRPRTLITSTATAVLIAGCGGSSSTPSASQIQNRLANDPAVKQKLAQVTQKMPISASKFKQITLTCITQSLQKNATPSSLADYASGKISASDVKFKTSKSQYDQQNYNCGRDQAMKALGQGG